MIQVFTLSLLTNVPFAEVGASLFQIALLLLALEQTLVSRVKERFMKKTEERRAN